MTERIEMITTSDKVVNDIIEELQERRESARIRRQKQEMIRANWESIKEKSAGYVISDRFQRESFVTEDSQMLYDFVPDGAWKDRRCFIVGGGKSLDAFDFKQLKNELVIGVNRAYEVVDCTIMFAMDHNLYDWIVEGKLGEKAKKKFKDFKGYPVWLDSSGYDYPKNVYILKSASSHRLSSSMRDGIGGGTNSGFGALNLAICLGANPIYLLGFDMRGEDGKQVHWHNGYPDKQSEKIYASFINDYVRVAPEIKKRGIKIINLNAGSDLKCFEFGKFEEMIPERRPIITSYYTKNTAYEQEVEHLKNSLRRFNLENDILGITDQGDWHKNTFYKPKFVMRMMKKYPSRPIVFVDADAKIRQNPVLFNDLDCDFACYFHHKKELLSGTLYFGNTRGSHYLVRQWLEEDRRHPNTHMPQKNLRAVFDRIKHKVNWVGLPVEYCMIFDSSARFKAKPVIEHFQLSRAHKWPEKKVKNYHMSQSLVGIRKDCRGKNICLLGNADSILRKKKKIDKFDIIGRMNHGKPRNKEDYIGSRTDILFLSTAMSRKSILASFNPRHVVWMTVCNRLAHPWVMRSAIQNPKVDWHMLYNELEINPTTGLMALYFILKHIDFKSLTIYGFDFFQTKTWYNTKIDNGQKHSGEKEKIMITKMIKDRADVRLL